jgi:hypothetical protein
MKSNTIGMATWPCSMALSDSTVERVALSSEKDVTTTGDVGGDGVMCCHVSGGSHLIDTIYSVSNINRGEI